MEPERVCVWGAGDRERGGGRQRDRESWVFSPSQPPLLERERERLGFLVPVSHHCYIRERERDLGF